MHKYNPFFLTTEVLRQLLGTIKSQHNVLARYSSEKVGGLPRYRTKGHAKVPRVKTDVPALKLTVAVAIVEPSLAPIVT